jgi:AAHS family 4-hydroxybenzoate transporter-like MFS transporter
MQICIESVVNDRPLGRYRMAMIAICFLIVLMDGFDTQAIGFAAAAISRSRGIPLSDFGHMFSAGLLGSAIGAFALGTLGDRIGRRRLLVVSILVFSVCSFALPRLESFPGILLCRFLTGLGLGGALPNLLALCAEYTPRPLHAVVTGLLFAGFPAGGVAGAIVSAHIVPLFGWPAIFYIGGSVPLVLACLSAAVLPLSLQAVLRHPDGQRQAAGIARRIAPKHPFPDSVLFVDTREPQKEVSLRQVYRSGGTLPTLMLWCTSFMCFVLLIDVALWTPALLRQQGITQSSAATVVGMFNLGSVIGTAFGGKLLDRLRPLTALPASFVAGGICIAMLGLAAGHVPVLALLCFLAGAFIGSCSAQLLCLAVRIYPSAMRASGVGWVVAFGRIGQIVGPLAIGALLSQGMAVKNIFLCVAFPALLAALSVSAFCRSRIGARSGSHFEGPEAQSAPLSAPERTTPVSTFEAP